MKENETLHEMMIRITALTNELTSLGKVISDEEQVDKVLRVLPKSKWNVKVTAIREVNKDLAGMTLNELVENLRTYDMKIDGTKMVAASVFDLDKDEFDEAALMALGDSDFEEEDDASKRGVSSGFPFHPTDTKGVTFLQKFMAKQEMNDSGFITTNIDVYDLEEEPWKIYSRGVPCGAADDSLYRYFITKKCSNLGNWKLQDERKPFHRDSSSSTVVIGCKKKMRYMVNNNEEHREDNGHYRLMKEYKLSNVILHLFDDDRRDYVLCAIKKNFIETCSSVMDNVSVEFGTIEL
ncbi:hypothetical protein CQW23_26621 [Capsicum baccatum]|uniref:NAC domain-containing protein n=1 Tax=Capsicum baccatum TaxID=33114 RepID=A0A2G2VPD3_CAPBA|nr:hypothetical protein CQW23_26621 [Capsicum baccatum]